MQKTDLTISTLKANLYAIPIVIISIILILGIFSFFNSMSVIESGFHSRYLRLPIFFMIFFLGAFIHELLHATSFILFGKLKLSQVKIGIIWKYLTPYAHCEVAVKTSVYRIALLIPTFVLGIIPSIIAMIFGLSWLIIYGTLFTVLGGGDILVFLLMRKLKGNFFVEDHPTRCGCVILDIYETHSDKS